MKKNTILHSQWKQEVRYFKNIGIDDFWWANISNALSSLFLHNFKIGRKNSDVAGFNDGQADSKIKAKEIVSAPNPGDF